MIIFSKLLFVISIVGLIRCSEKFRTASREFDERAFAAVKRMIHATEDSGYSAQTGPLLILVMTLCFMMAMYAVETAALR